jgi:hypothetical protein
VERVTGEEGWKPFLVLAPWRKAAEARGLSTDHIFLLLVLGATSFFDRPGPLRLCRQRHAHRPAGRLARAADLHVRALPDATAELGGGVGQRRRGARPVVAIVIYALAFPDTHGRGLEEISDDTAVALALELDVMDR